MTTDVVDAYAEVLQTGGRDLLDDVVVGLEILCSKEGVPERASHLLAEAALRNDDPGRALSALRRKCLDDDEAVCLKARALKGLGSVEEAVKLLSSRGGGIAGRLLLAKYSRLLRVTVSVSRASTQKRLLSKELEAVSDAHEKSGGALFPYTLRNAWACAPEFPMRIDAAAAFGETSALLEYLKTGKTDDFRLERFGALYDVWTGCVDRITGARHLKRASRSGKRRASPISLDSDPGCPFVYFCEALDDDSLAHVLMDYQPNRARSWIVAAKFYAKSGDLDAAAACASRAVDSGENFKEGFDVKGKVHLERSEFASAAAAFKNSLELGKSGIGFAGLAQAYLGLGRTKDAMNVSRDFLNSNPKNPEALVLVGDVLRGSRRCKDDALAFYEKAVKIDPHDLKAVLAVAGFHYADHRQTNEGTKLEGVPTELVDDMVRMLEKAKAINSLDSRLWETLGCWLASKGEEMEAASAWNEAVRLNPDKTEVARKGLSHWRV